MIWPTKILHYLGRCISVFSHQTLFAKIAFHITSAIFSSSAWSYSCYITYVSLMHSPETDWMNCVSQRLRILHTDTVLNMRAVYKTTPQGQNRFNFSYINFCVNLIVTSKINSVSNYVFHCQFTFVWFANKKKSNPTPNPLINPIPSQWKQFHPKNLVADFFQSVHQW